MSRNARRVSDNDVLLRGGTTAALSMPLGLHWGWAELRYDRAVLALSIAPSQLYQKPR